MTDEPADFAEACFLLLGFIYIGSAAFPVDVLSLDKWIDEHAAGDSRDKYRRKRAAAVEAYRVYLRQRESIADTHWTDGLEDLREAVEDMHGIVHLLRAQILAHAKAKANQSNREISTKPRLKGRSPLRAKILRLMKQYRADHTEFKIFLKVWEADVLHGLRLAVTESGFLVTDENGDDCAQRQYTYRTLQLMYSRASSI